MGTKFYHHPDKVHSPSLSWIGLLPPGGSIWGLISHHCNYPLKRLLSLLKKRNFAIIFEVPLGEGPYSLKITDAYQDGKGTLFTAQQRMRWLDSIIRLNGHEFEQTLGDSERQGSLVFYSPWGHNQLDITERLNNNKSYHKFSYIFISAFTCYWIFIVTALYFNDRKKIWRWFYNVSRQNKCQFP